MFCSAVSIGSRLNAWKTKPTRLRRVGVIARSDMRFGSVSARKTRPDAGVSSPATQCISVDVPSLRGP